MPLYEYKCDKCGLQFELIRKLADPPVTTCLKCGGSVRKLMSAPAIRFKGSGWYVTDYAKKDSAGSKPAPAKGSQDKAASGTSTGGDSGKATSKTSTQSTKSNSASSGASSAEKASSKKPSR
ncbi:MAG TPA: FmdB family transcriptional regulator [Acidobacteria bacterium]|nr:FmdB family transcriptional regulator [Acidobacteriota bacterium]